MVENATIPYAESPLVPNWSDGYVIEYQFKTDITRSRSGREPQRRATRNEARKKLEFSVAAARARFGLFNRVLERWLDTAIILPELPRFAVLGVALPGGNTVATLTDAAPAWIAADYKVVLSYGGRYETRTVDAVAGDEVTFTDFSDTEWPVGTKVHPALPGRLTDTSATRLTNQVSRASVEFEVLPGSEPVETLPAAAETFNGRETFMTKFNWAKAPDVAVSSQRETVDYDVGVTATFTPVAFRDRVVKATFLGRDFAEAELLRQFFERMKGQRGEFYMPSWEPDIEVMGTASAGTNTLTVEGTEFARDFEDSTIHKALCVFMRDGTTLYRLITAIEEVGDNSRITVTGNWPSNLTADTVRMISWFFVCRHATDTLAVEWVTNSVAQMQFSIKALEAI